MGAADNSEDRDIRLFEKRKPVRRLIYTIVISIVATLSVLNCRAADFEVGGGRTYIRGPAPVATATMVWPRQIWDTDVYAGAVFIGSYDFRGVNYGNQYIARAGFTPRFGSLGVDLGLALLKNSDAINSGTPNFNLGLSYDFGPNFAVNLGHISNARTHLPNIGRDFVTLTYRFH